MVPLEGSAGGEQFERLGLPAGEDERRFEAGEASGDAVAGPGVVGLRCGRLVALAALREARRTDGWRNASRARVVRGEEDDGDEES
jgi:hypothetical protein